MAASDSSLRWISSWMCSICVWAKGHFFHLLSYSFATRRYCKWLLGWIARIIANNVRVNVPSSNRYVMDKVESIALNDNQSTHTQNHTLCVCDFEIMETMNGRARVYERQFVRCIGRCTFRIHESRNEIMFGSVFCCYYWIRFWLERASASLGSDSFLVLSHGKYVTF